MKSKAAKLESLLDELEKIIQQMDSKPLALEESLALFERGVQLTKMCQELLSRAEQRVKQLSQKSEAFQFTEYVDPQEDHT